jgi:hypothetical protein
MTRVLNLSDYPVILSDEYSKSAIHNPAQTSPPARTRPAFDRTDAARVADRDVQALRTAQLPLCRRTRARPQAISVHNQSNWGASAGRLRTERNPHPSRRVPRQLPQGARGAQRDLRNQCRTSAPARESRLDASDRCSSRLRQGGHHRRQHDRSLSCCWRPVVKPGGSRS